MPQKAPKNTKKRPADKKEEYDSKEERDALIRAGYVLPLGIGLRHSCTQLQQSPGNFDVLEPAERTP